MIIRQGEDFLQDWWKDFFLNFGCFRVVKKPPLSTHSGSLKYYLKVYGSIWKYMEVYGSLWKYMEVWKVYGSC
jgi:hypothetical protein